ncbi:MAG: ABC transporter permease [Acidimicrobiales bacterium]|nr:ABC transporter permease [Acidimicrobiales bacterium]
MRYVRQKVIQLVVVLLVVSFLTFLMINLLPGDPALTITGPGASQEQIDQVREDLGLDKPLPVRYLTWLGNALQGDLGDSYASKVPVSQLIQERLPISILIMAYAMLIALVVAIPLGVLTAYRSGGVFDRSSNTITFGLLAIPNYILGVLLVYLFALQLNWFPALSSYVGFFDDPVEHVRTMILPALTLALGQIAVYQRLLRTDMLATLQNDFITMARAKGMPTRRILLFHALRPSSFSLLTVAAVNVGALIGGAVIVEQIFGLPGMGNLIVTAIFQRDYVVVQGAVTVIAIGFVLVNFLVDMLYAALDPRIRHARAIA